MKRNTLLQEKDMVRNSRLVVVAVLVVMVAGCAGVSPFVPVEISVRPALIGDGGVITLHNLLSNHALTCTVTCTADDEKMEMLAKIPAGGTVEIGWLQGWTWRPGERVKVSHRGYLPREWTVPH